MSGPHEGKAWVLRRQGHWEECLVVLNRIVELDPQTANIYREIGETYSNLRRFEEAETAAKKGLELTPEDPAAIALSRCLARRTRFRNRYK